MKYIAFLILALALAGNYSSADTAKSRITSEEEIQIVVFRYQLHPPQNLRHKKDSLPRMPDGSAPPYEPDEVIFLRSLQGRDPTDVVMKNFAEHQPPVKKVSQSQLVASGGKTTIRDRKTSARGSIYSVDSIKWISKNRVRVEGSHDAGTRSGHGSIYSVIRKNKKWVVENSRNTWVS